MILLNEIIQILALPQFSRLNNYFIFFEGCVAKTAAGKVDKPRYAFSPSDGYCCSVQVAAFLA